MIVDRAACRSAAARRSRRVERARLEDRRRAASAERQRRDDRAGRDQHEQQPPRPPRRCGQIAARSSADDSTNSAARPPAISAALGDVRHGRPARARARTSAGSPTSARRRPPPRRRRATTSTPTLTHAGENSSRASNCRSDQQHVEDRPSGARRRTGRRWSRAARAGRVKRQRRIELQDEHEHVAVASTRRPPSCSASGGSARSRRRVAPTSRPIRSCPRRVVEPTSTAHDHACSILPRCRSTSRRR